MAAPVVTLILIFIVGVEALARITTNDRQGETATAPVPAGARQPPSRARPSPPEAIEAGRNEFGGWGGGSFDSPKLIGETDDARFGVAGVRYGRVLAEGDSAALKYTIDLIPIAALSYRKPALVEAAPGRFVQIRRRTLITAAGLSPIGFQVNFSPRRRMQPFAGTSGGFLYFTDPIPDGTGARFNFTVDFGGGVQVFTNSRRALILGYKYHHISNGFRAPSNPGFDSNIFYAGFSFFK